jgi:hypothetical protein
MRVSSNSLELELNEAIVELRRTDFLLANFDLQALFVESVGKYYSEDVALLLQDKLTEGKLASFRRMADAVDPIHTLLEMGMASIDKFRLTSTYLSRQGEHTADWELVLGGTYSTRVPIRWRTNRVWKEGIVVAEFIRSLP